MRSNIDCHNNSPNQNKYANFDDYLINFFSQNPIRNEIDIPYKNRLI